nr:MAG TPA: capsid protein [Caudoviricetes sp.]
MKNSVKVCLPHSLGNSCNKSFFTAPPICGGAPYVVNGILLNCKGAEI